MRVRRVSVNIVKIILKSSFGQNYFKKTWLKQCIQISIRKIKIAGIPREYGGKDKKTGALVKYIYM